MRPFLAIPLNGFSVSVCEERLGGAFRVSVSGGKNPVPGRAQRRRKAWPFYGFAIRRGKATRTSRGTLTYHNLRRQTRFGFGPFSFGFRLFRCFDPDVQKYLSTKLPSRSCSGPSQPRQSRGFSCVAGASMRATRYSALQTGQRNFVELSGMGAIIARLVLAVPV